MGFMFDPNEVFQIAVRIEENGERFYRQMAEKLDDEPEVRRLFLYLADEEIKHRDYYRELLESVGEVEPEEAYPGEYFDYLNSYANGIIFSQEAFEKKIAEIETLEGALDFAIGAEWDAIHFYQEMQGLVSKSRRSQLEEIIAEERRHFVKLSKIRKDRRG
jgi:rubrerythrin